jgi:hypothetical protein
VRHQSDRPIAFVGKLQQRLPAELYTSFAAAVAAGWAAWNEPTMKE